VSEAEKRCVETLRIFLLSERSNGIDNIIAGAYLQQSGYDSQRHEVTATFGFAVGFMVITNSAGGKFTATTRILNHFLLLRIMIMMEETNIRASSAKMVARTPAQNGLIIIVVVLLV
jgi:hypothetical protein